MEEGDVPWDLTAQILRNFRSKENDFAFRPLVNYVDRVSFLDPLRRAQTVSWMGALASFYNLRLEVLCNSVSYMDRFLSSDLSREDTSLESVALVSMSIASRYEDGFGITYPAFNLTCGFQYCPNLMAVLEEEVLNSLDQRLGLPTVATFLLPFIRMAEVLYNERSERSRCLAHFLAELSLLEHKLLNFKPSTVAAAALFLARFTLSPTRHPWTSDLAEVTDYKPEDLVEVVKLLHELHRRVTLPNEQATTRTRYQTPERQNVSNISAPLCVPAAFFMTSAP